MKRDQLHSPEMSRRGFVKTAVYVSPAILTLKADSAYASYGSGKRLDGNQGIGVGAGPNTPEGPGGNASPGSGSTGNGRGNPGQPGRR